MDEEFLVPREKILHPPSKAAMDAADEICGKTLRNRVTIAWTIARYMAEERERAKLLAMRVRARLNDAVPEWAPELREALEAYEEARGEEAGSG